MSQDVEEVLMEVIDSSKLLVNSRLAELTDLSSSNLELFKRSWGTIEPPRRRQICSMLVELAADNVELNFDGIFKQCLGDTDGEVQKAAIDGLWENEQVSIIAPLLKLLNGNTSEKVQAAAAVALGKFVMLAEHGKLNPVYASRVQESLLAVFNDQNRDVEVRRRALEALAPACLPEVKTIIMNSYLSDDSRLVIGALYAMGRNCDPSWLPILLTELESADSERRYEATGACGELEDKAAVPSLIRLMDDTDIDVRLAGIQALGKIGGNEAKKRLEASLKSRTEAIRQAAQAALEELAAKENSVSLPSGKFEQDYDYR